MGDPGLVLPVDVEASGVAAWLGERLKLVAERPVTGERVELDTFDGRLQEHDLVAELAQDGGTAVVRADGAVAPVADARRIRAADLPPGPVLDTLEPVIENRALLPGPRVRTRTLPLRVLNSDDKTVVKVLVEEAEVVRRGQRTLPLRPRVQLVEVRGYQGSRNRVERLLREELGLTPAVERRSSEAIRALGGDPTGVSTKVDIDLTRDEPSSVALARVLLRLAEIVDANHAGTVDDLDPEFLHDLRVSIRRSRSMLREVKRVLAPEPRRRWRTELKWVQTVTGAARDLDVHLEDFEEYRQWLPQALEPDLAPLRELLEQERARAVRSMRRSLRSARYRDGWAGYKRYLERVRTGTEPIDADAQPNATRRIGKVAARRIRAVYRDMVEMGSAIDETSHPQALHDLRKRGKELRYLLEIFGDLYDPGEAQAMVKVLKALQDTLGAHQDRHVQSDALRALGPDLAKLERGPAALMAMGLLVDRLDGEQAAARRRVRGAVRGLRSAQAPEGGQGSLSVRTVATYNIKGGVGKTSAAVNLAALAARGGLRTLLWDLDPQGAATYLLRIKPRVRGGGRKLVRGKSDVDALIKGSDVEGLDLLPADFSYRHMDLALDGGKKPTRRLGRVVAPLAAEYDLLLLDCPPSISLVSENVFDVADALLVPLIPATLSVRTFEQLRDFVSAEVPRRPDVIAFFSMVDRRKKLHRQVMDELHSVDDDGHGVVAISAIPAATDVEQMGVRRMPLADFAPRSRAATAYADLWSEVRARLEL